MTRRALATLLFLAVSLFGLNLCAQQNEDSDAPAEAAAKPAADKGKPEAAKEKPAAMKEEPPVVTHHQITVNGKVLKYTATTGYMPLRNSETDEIEANIFFVAYTLDDPAGKRPLMFSFNGGPGSASVWLHLGAIGPRRVKMLPDGEMPPPPFELIDNQQTWLDQTDLVFIDPVGTGFSRAAKKELGKKFWSCRRRHRVGWRLHSPVSDALPALEFAAVSGGRELRHDARCRAERIPDQSRHRAEWRRADFVGAEFPDAGIRRRQRSAVHPVSAELHLDGVVSQEAACRLAAARSGQRAVTGGAVCRRAVHAGAGQRRLAHAAGAR